MIEIKINGETVTSKVIPRNHEELQADFLRVLLVLRHVIEKHTGRSLANVMMEQLCDAAFSEDLDVTIDEYSEVQHGS